jgi:hypothetical protein
MHNAVRLKLAHTMFNYVQEDTEQEKLVCNISMEVGCCSA